MKTFKQYIKESGQGGGDGVGKGMDENIGLPLNPDAVRIVSPFDEFGEVDFKAEDAVRKIAKDRDLGITSGRELAAIAKDKDGNVVGGAFVEFEPSSGEFSFDVVVREGTGGHGVGSRLLDDVLQQANQFDVDGPDFHIKADVVNPQMRKMLEKRGFEVTQTVGKDRWIMEPRNTGGLVTEPDAKVTKPTHGTLTATDEGFVSYYDETIGGSWH
jgi:GNAT superfamily N-acetyltransferase